MTKYTEQRHTQVTEVLAEFITAANIKYETDSYALGYLKSALVGIACEHLSDEAFAHFLRSMERGIALQQPKVTV